MKKKLIINADDFGITNAVSEAIVDIYKKGSLSSATMLVNMPGLRKAAALAKENPGLAIGLHFNITEGISLLGTSSLTDSTGRFFKRIHLFKKILQGKVRKQDVKREIAIQFQILNDLGITPTHIDSHQHSHMLPFVFKEVADFARFRKIPVRICVPQTLQRVEKGTCNLVKLFKQKVLEITTARNRKYSKELISNDSFNSVFDIHPYQFPLKQDYELLIMNARGNQHELMVHPYILSEELKEAYPGDLYEKKTGFFKKAEKEYQTLAGMNIKKWLESSGMNWEWSTYRDLR